MEINTRRKFFGKLTAIAAFAAGTPKLLTQQVSSDNTTRQSSSSTAPPSGDSPRRSGGNHVHNGIYYFSGIGANDGYAKEDHILVTDAFDKHVTRTLDALKKSVERAGSNMENIIHLDVFLCLPHADGIPVPTGKARFDAHKAQYDSLNKLYGTYFSGKSPSRACLAVEWIPGDSLIEIVGNALVVTPSSAVGEK